MLEHNIIIKNLSQLMKDTLFQQEKLKSIMSQIDDIFFESSPKKSFISDSDKQQFKYKYVSYYQKRYPDLFFIAYEIKENGAFQVIAYICASENTLKDEELFNLNPYLEAFKGACQKYPAHLHINCSSYSRGKGLGAKLIVTLESALREKKCNGLHLITSPNARNVNFYEKNKFNERFNAVYGEAKLLLMAKKL